jgi:hypothetical protein
MVAFAFAAGALVVVGGGAVTATVAARRAAHDRRRAARRRRTLLDVADGAGAEALVRALERPSDGADALADRLLALWRAFPPDERAMRALSLAQQAHAGEGGARDFCATLAYATATEARCDDATPPHRVPATRSSRYCHTTRPWRSYTRRSSSPSRRRYSQ